MMAIVSANAQHREGEFSIQPRVGVTFSTLTNTDDAKMKINLTYGAEYEQYITDQFSLAGGVLFTNQGFKYDDGDGTLNNYYFAVPITANYYVVPGLAVKAGVQPGFKMRAKAKLDDRTIDLDDLYKLDQLLTGEDIKVSKFDLSIPVGISYEYKNIVLDARYNWGLVKVLNVGDAFYNRCFMLSLGYKLELGN